MKTKKPNQPQIMTKEEFDQVNAAHHEMLRRDPCGNEANRKTFEELRKSWDDGMAKIEAAKKKGQK